MCHNFSQTRGEIMHEFSLIEYYVRSALTHFLTSQPEQTCKKYRQQFDRFRKFISQRPIKWNPRVLRNPDVQRMDAELMAAADRQFNNCLNQLPEAAEKANFSKIADLRSLKEEIETASHKRNLLTHSVWIEEQGKIVMLNYPDFHERKWMLINRKCERLNPQPLPKWTLQELQNFNAHLHDLSERLTNIFPEGNVKSPSEWEARVRRKRISRPERLIPIVRKRTAPNPRNLNP
jgi:hypothetical protein